MVTATAGGGHSTRIDKYTVAWNTGQRAHTVYRGLRARAPPFLADIQAVGLFAAHMCCKWDMGSDGCRDMYIR
jgi:hypothetical protein